LQAERPETPSTAGEPPALVPAPSASIRSTPAEEPAERAQVRPAAAPPPGPRSAAAPARTVIEAAPDFPGPIEIRPAPGQGVTGAGNRKGTKSAAPAPKPPSGSPPPGALTRPPEAQAPTLGRSVLDLLSGPQR
jgi:hypothetical protein